MRKTNEASSSFRFEDFDQIQWYKKYIEISRHKLVGDIGTLQMQCKVLSNTLNTQTANSSQSNRRQRDVCTDANCLNERADREQANNFVQNALFPQKTFLKMLGRGCRFHPYWDGETFSLDTIPSTLTAQRPQSFIPKFCICHYLPLRIVYILRKLARTSSVGVGWERFVVFAVKQVDKRLQQSLYVFCAVVTELHQKVKQPQHLSHQTMTIYRVGQNYTNTFLPNVIIMACKLQNPTIYKAYIYTAWTSLTFAINISKFKCSTLFDNVFAILSEPLQSFSTSKL